MERCGTGDVSRIVCVGEGMLELRREDEEWRLGTGGDVLNTAIHLARLGHDVAFLSALGSDPFSGDLRQRWRAEGLDTSLVLTHPERHCGLYAISTDEHGERSFTYWREASAARETFALPESDAAIAQAERADLLYFSLITLAILPAGGRRRLLDLAGRVRASGGKVAFDGNYRARLWGDPAEAMAARDAAIAVADFGLPTLSDEIELGGGKASAAAAHWRDAGCDEVVLKLGAEGCLLPSGKAQPPPERAKVLDSSGAGDAFNAGYLAARLRGSDAAEAALQGQRLA
ncbi:MAG: sugar kinase, partial [Porphyrobacter sp.]|nr:sugar kinase [Porphyrobacter sp.]